MGLTMQEICADWVSYTLGEGVETEVDTRRENVSFNVEPVAQAVRSFTNLYLVFSPQICNWGLSCG